MTIGNRLIVLMVVAIAGTFAEQALPDAVDATRYEDHYTFKPGRKPYGYTVDPWVWAYTKEFADKFRMPEKWIDPDIKGVLAVAFRMSTIGNMNCGYGDKVDNCWPVNECQLDVYYDNRIKLPWTHEEIKQDFLLRGVSSREFLHDLNQDKEFKRYAKRDHSSSVFGTWSGGVIRVGEYSSGPASVSFFDSEYQPGVGMVGWIGLGVCPKSVGVGRMDFFDVLTVKKLLTAQIKRSDAKPMHTFEFSESFMRRANLVYQAENKSNQEVAQRLIRQFFESRKTAP